MTKRHGAAFIGCRLHLRVNFTRIREGVNFTVKKRQKLSRKESSVLKKASAG